MTNPESNDTAATAAEQGATVAPANANSTKPARRKKNAPKGQKAPQGSKPKKAARAGKKPTAASRTLTKAATILELIGRGKGASITEIQQATGWQAHSVRGFLSTAGKKHGIKIESSQNESGGRVYRAAK